METPKTKVYRLNGSLGEEIFFVTLNVKTTVLEIEAFSTETGDSYATVEKFDNIDLFEVTKLAVERGVKIESKGASECKIIVPLLRPFVLKKIETGATEKLVKLLQIELKSVKKELAVLRSTINLAHEYATPICKSNPQILTRGGGHNSYYTQSASTEFQTLDFRQEMDFNYLKLGFYDGDSRTYTWNADYSNDNENWISLVKGQNSSSEFRGYVTQVKARYLRFSGLSTSNAFLHLTFCGVYLKPSEQ
eukprot:TRINITY_DN10739_c0_g1_i1.p1 TRINITY_DN10739_c0_g1~~TRINITY_DN10739_c0_g1_i1.p1  ORF type:complete len:249 (+),score=27.31 TRINITY_DN10739_c0_g1_i1:54-800(+)